MMLRDRVLSMIRRLEREDTNMHGFLLTVGGNFKAGAYYSPFREGQPQSDVRALFHYLVAEANRSYWA